MIYGQLKYIAVFSQGIGSGVVRVLQVFQRIGMFIMDTGLNGSLDLDIGYGSLDLLHKERPVCDVEK